MLTPSTIEFATMGSNKDSCKALFEMTADVKERYDHYKNSCVFRSVLLSLTGKQEYLVNIGIYD